MQNTAVIILAAGKGKRMESDLPKALTPLGGKPFVSYVVEAVEKSTGIRSHIVVGHGREQVMEHLGDSYPYVVQTEQLGTGHAVFSAKDSLGHDAKTVLVLYADQPLIKPETIATLLTAHEPGNAMTMATVSVPNFEGMHRNFLRFSRIIRDDSGSIVRSVEFKDATSEEHAMTEVNPAYFVFSVDWLWSHLPLLQNKNAGGEYYLTDLIGIARNEGAAIGSVSIDPASALGANSKEELAVLEQILAQGIS